ncbi:MAG: A24 family peptidase [Planctomycetia bacterium]|nr:A24 family peptidase [Planctomycetia bacterium]
MLSEVLHALHPAAFVNLLVGLLGAIVGSFLNVVIYRLPRGMSVMKPSRSFCPDCWTPIRARHNIPILSWLMLRGRCFSCRRPIPLRYPLVEACCALIFVTVWDQLFIAGTLPGKMNLPRDWPLQVGYFTLFACLLAASVMDIDTYTLDIRVCVLAMVGGAAAHTARGLSSTPLGTLPPALCAIGAAMGLTWLVVWIAVTMFSRRATNEADDDPPVEEPESGQHAEASAAESFAPAPVILMSVLIVALVGWQIVAPDWPAGLRLSGGGIRGLVAFMVLFFMLVLTGWSAKPVDSEILEELAETQPSARRTAFAELLWLMPSLTVGIALFAWLRGGNLLGADWSDVTRQPWLPHWLMTHFAGLVFSVGSLVWGAALGWTVRILGTFAFGKEAYGTGDIYLMAAIAAVAGIWNCFLGFFAAALLALVGIAVIMIKRTRRAIPFGPWLALGSFLLLVLERPMLEFFSAAGSTLWNVIQGRGLH